METSKAEGKRSFKYSNTEEEDQEEEEEEEEDDEDDGGLGGFRELDGKKKREITSSSRKPSGSGGSSPPTCQVESCNADLTGAKHYHRRHKVCEFHAKAAVVHVAGGQKRFCQQCSRLENNPSSPIISINICLFLHSIAPISLIVLYYKLYCFLTRDPGR